MEVVHNGLNKTVFISQCAMKQETLHNKVPVLIQTEFNNSRKNIF